jgi:hypothetical protein
MAGVHLHEDSGVSFLHKWGISVATVELSSFERRWPVCVLPASYAQTGCCKNLGNLRKTCRRASGIWRWSLKACQSQEHMLAVSMHVPQLQLKHAFSFHRPALGTATDTADGCSVSVFQPQSERAVCHSLVRHLPLHQGHAVSGCFSHLGSRGFCLIPASHIPLPWLGWCCPLGQFGFVNELRAQSIRVLRSPFLTSRHEGLPLM